MALEGLAAQLLAELKYAKGYPPRRGAQIVKNELAARQLAQSTILADEVARVYLESVEPLLDTFAEAVLANSEALGLRTEEARRKTLAEAHQQMFDEARGGVLDEVPGEFGRRATGAIDERRRIVWEHLERKVELSKLGEAPPPAIKEREQKFGILYSAAQAERDFSTWVAENGPLGNGIAIMFVDIDHFKALNERLTHVRVDETIMPEIQKTIAKLVQGRGGAYRYGGEEFVVVLPNLDPR